MIRKLLLILALVVGIGSVANGQDQREYVSPTIGTLKYVPPGQFQRDDNMANISVISKPFRMSEYEITRAQFQKIMGADPSNIRYSSGQNDPVQNVNWYHAIAFCNKLSLAEGLTPVYAVSGVDFSTLTFGQIPTGYNETWKDAAADWSANGYRLPTEMEWMWAAMGAPADGQGGRTNTTGYQKAFAGSTGNNAIGDFAVFGWNGTEIGRTTTERTNPVGTKMPNELGLYDMSGNVFEWVWDFRKGDWPYYGITGTQTDYRGSETREWMPLTLRGGSWLSKASSCDLSIKGIGLANLLYYHFGFRVILQ